MNFNWIDILSTVSGCFPIIAALYNFRYLDKTLKILTVFFVLSFLFDVALISLASMGTRNNMPLIHADIVLTIVFYSIIYYRAFFSRTLKVITAVLSSVTLIVVLYYARLIWVYPSESNTVSGILFIMLSLFYFYQILTRQEFIHIEKQGLFWINAGILFYYAVNIFLFMLFRKIISRNLQEYFIIHSITNIIANLLYSVGLLCKPQTTA